MEIATLLKIALEKGASDLHLSSNLVPMLRIDGDLVRLDFPIFAVAELRAMLCNLMNLRQQQEFEQKLETDFSFSIPNLGRFRANIFTHELGIGAAFRIIADKIISLEQLGLPNLFRQICQTKHGLVLVSGPTGSGKSTTLAVMINYINQTKSQHILTIEDPIEYIHISNRCLVNQREVHRDTLNFNTALRSALREDPDIILVGELRDLETMRLAITAAETGHLVFATLHTFSAAKTINRIIDVFPGDEKNLIRSMLAESLSAIISQTLVKKIDGGRVAAFEVLVATPAVRNLIREDKIPQIYSAIQTGASYGMQSFEQHLKILGEEKVISM